MKTVLIAIFLSSVSLRLCGGETLRISEVGTQGGADTERMTLKTEDGEEPLFVKKEAVLTDQDVKKAWVEADGQISVQLRGSGE